MATFLWNLMDRPGTAHTASYGDVRSDAHYADAVRWLEAEGITTGRADGTFAPTDEVTRGQMASFLWRLAGRPAPQGHHGFPDVRDRDHFAEAAAWMVEQRITTGTTNGTFAGNEVISRSQMALFLHRLATNPSAWTAATAVPSAASAS
jgi:hypothetical protein